MKTTSTSADFAAHPPTPQAVARVGPNAILQLAAALQSHCGPDTGRRIIASAGLSHVVASPPAGLVAEDEAARLFAATRTALSAVEADTVLATAGRRTADYIVENRIPVKARRLLRYMPTWIAVRVFLAAIKAHAWTFAGSGVVSIDVGRRMALTICHNPLATPGCPWHVAVLEQLLRQCVTPSARVTHVRCGPADRFVMETRAEQRAGVARGQPNDT